MTVEELDQFKYNCKGNRYSNLRAGMFHLKVSDIKHIFCSKSNRRWSLVYPNNIVLLPTPPQRTATGGEAGRESKQQDGRIEYGSVALTAYLKAAQEQVVGGRLMFTKACWAASSWTSKRW